MIIKYTLLMISLVIFTTCKATNDDKNNINTDTTNFTIICYDYSYSWIFDNAEPTNLNEIELQKIDEILLSCIKKYNQEQEDFYNITNTEHPEYNLNKNDFLIELADYNRQYIPALIENKDKVVWVNCFCSHDEMNWRENIISVLDGGNCFFNLKINLKTKSYYDFIVNGEA